MEIEIRRMDAGQVDVAVDVWVRSRRDAQPWLEKRMNYTQDQNLAFFRDVVMAEQQVWLAIEDGRVLGVMALADGEIDQLHVDPEAQNRGVGSALLGKARELHPDRLGLFTHQRNEKARRFYERRGFVAVRFGVSPAPENEPDVRYEWSSGGDL
jgi:ribosomal protein S18 acetylase RimI-like enzyme